MNLDQYYNVEFIHPARWIIFGPSGSGKSTFVLKYLKAQQYFYGKLFDNIVYSSESVFPSQNIAKCLNIKFIDKLTDEVIDSFQPNKRNLIIFDDQMHEITNNILISNLFTKKSHHRNITVMFLTQNLYPRSKYMRDISINSNYIVLMRNPVEMLQIKCLSHRIETKSNENLLLKAYKEATKQPYSYLLLDLCQELRYRTQIFPCDEFQIVYC
jgi:GTPase SAR1 family protein